MKWKLPKYYPRHTSYKNSYGYRTSAYDTIHVYGCDVWFYHDRYGRIIAIAPYDKRPDTWHWRSSVSLPRIKSFKAFRRFIRKWASNLPRGTELVWSGRFVKGPKITYVV